MILKDYLKTLDKDETIALGTETGGSFMYFGKPDEELIKQMFKDFEERRRKTLKNHYKSLRGIFSKSYDANNNEKLMRVSERVYNLVSHIRSDELWFKRHRPILERNIIDTFDKYTGEWAVIIEGNECGKYMFKEEYDKKNKQNV